MIKRHADFRPGGDPGIVERRFIFTFRDMNRAARSADAIIAALEILQPAKMGLYGIEVPAPVALLCPGIVILRLSAHVNQSIDGRGAAQNLATRDRNGAVGCAFLGLRAETPVGFGVIQQQGETNGELGPEITFLTSFQHQNLVLAIGAQTVG